MTESYRRRNYILLVVAILFTGFVIYIQAVNDFVMINETLALILFDVGICFKIFELKKGQYFLLLFICILLLNTFNVTYTISSENDKTSYSSTTTKGFGINPIILLILILYIVVNKNAVKSIYDRVMYGSEKEKGEKVAEEINFYYNKFSSYKDEELIEVFTMYNDYPLEAQYALKKIHEERKLSLLTF